MWPLYKVQRNKNEDLKMITIICDGIERKVYPTTYEQLNGEWIPTPALLLKQAD